MDCLVGFGQIRAQKVFNVETPAEGSIELAAGININKVNSGYTLWLPETDSVKGLVLFTHARRDTVNDDLLIREALKEQLAVMYATTDNRLEFFFSIKRLKEIENYLQKVQCLQYILQLKDYVLSPFLKVLIGQT